MSLPLKIIDKLILASSSPRRLDLLNQMGIMPRCVYPANIDETPLKKELPRVFVQRMALEKAQAVSNKNLNSFVLAADTIVAVGRRILGKPANAKEALNFLTLLSGKRHRVYTAITLYNPLTKYFHQKTEYTHVRFKNLHSDEIMFYLSTGEWEGKAGAYSIQGFASCFIQNINGSYTNVIGLPLSSVYALFLSNNLSP